MKCIFSTDHLLESLEIQMKTPSQRSKPQAYVGFQAKGRAMKYGIKKAGQETVSPAVPSDISQPEWTQTWPVPSPVMIQSTVVNKGLLVLSVDYHQILLPPIVIEQSIVLKTLLRKGGKCV